MYVNDTKKKRNEKSGGLFFREVGKSKVGVCEYVCVGEGAKREIHVFVFFFLSIKGSEHVLCRYRKTMQRRTIVFKIILGA